jgi:hypothetical protein
VGFELKELPFRYIAAIPQSGFVRRPAVQMPDDADRWRNVQMRS